jgi:hypothetical protein
MIKFGNGGSIAMIASMSATVANRVGLLKWLDVTKTFGKRAEAVRA